MWARAGMCGSQHEYARQSSKAQPVLHWRAVLTCALLRLSSLLPLLLLSAGPLCCRSVLLQGHTLTSVTINGVTDPEGDGVTLKVTQILQNEGTKASDTGITGTWACPDGKITTTQGKVQLVPECLNAKAASVPGRTYLIKFTATDAKGASCTGSVTVCVKPGTTGICESPTAPTIDATVCK